MNTQASQETYCPDHPGHIMTRSGYCIHGQHRPENVGEPVARGMWLVEHESSELPQVEVETDMSKTAQLPIADRQGYEDIDFGNEPEMGEITTEASMEPGTVWGEAAADTEAPDHEVVDEDPHDDEDLEAEGFLDEATGEIHEPAAPRQMVLDPNLFPPAKREKVKTVKIGFSGSDERTRHAFDEMCPVQLEPGRIVTLTVTGYVPGPHSEWVKRTEGRGDDKDVWWEQEGQVKIKVTGIVGEMVVGGFYRDYD
jgi:hypothetical protein